ncbi:MAG: hypothetical protein V4519_04885 [Patescibacteria group bacterium]
MEQPRNNPYEGEARDMITSFLLDSMSGYNDKAVIQLILDRNDPVFKEAIEQEVKDSIDDHTEIKKGLSDQGAQIQFESNEDLDLELEQLRQLQDKLRKMII